MKKFILLICLNLILSSCTEAKLEIEIEIEQAQEMNQNLSPSEINERWKHLNNRVYRCEKQCPRKDLAEISFYQVNSYYMIFIQGKTGFIEEFYPMTTGIKINVNWDDGSGGFKNENLELTLLDQRQLKVRDKLNNMNDYQFVKFDDE